MTKEILPAILPKNLDQLLTQAELVEEVASTLHIDVLEDTFIPDGIELGTPFETHLMVKGPIELAKIWIEEGAQRIIAHTLPREILELRDVVEIGLGVELHIPLEEIYEELEHVDFVNLMSIKEIGKQGNKFEPEIFDRIKELKREFPQVVISVDGGVKLDNYKELFLAGADRLIVGSAIFGSGDPAESFEKFLE
jgi:ribulose-phosphate 3-epimerase